MLFALAATPMGKAHRVQMYVVMPCLEEGKCAHNHKYCLSEAMCFYAEGVVWNPLKQTTWGVKECLPWTECMSRGNVTMPSAWFTVDGRTSALARGGLCVCLCMRGVESFTPGWTWKVGRERERRRERERERQRWDAHTTNSKTHWSEWHSCAECIQQRHILCTGIKSSHFFVKKGKCF